MYLWYSVHSQGSPHFRPYNKLAHFSHGLPLSDKNPGPHSAKPVQNSMDQLMEILKILVRRV